MRVLFVAEGDAETPQCWSGCAQGFVHGLRRQGAEVTCVNVDVAGWRRFWIALRSFSPKPRVWRWRFRLGEAAFLQRSRIGERRLRGLDRGWDAVVQTGATAALTARAAGPVPRIVYCDANVRFAQRGRPYSGISSLDDRMIDVLARREKEVYDQATRIWTWSHALAASFVADFEQPPAKVRTIYAGANLNTASFGPPNGNLRDRAPSILFVGKDYRRKGLDVLVEAFARVRTSIPSAILHVVGACPPWARQPGVRLHGFVPSGTPEGARKLADLYLNATVFCLPTRYEPFGVSFIEAMLAGLPCVGTRSWAMPEIIEDGHTGWLVPEGDAVTLAQVLRSCLMDPDGSAAMGSRGRDRAVERFTWDRVAARAMEDLRVLTRSDEPDGTAQ